MKNKNHEKMKNKKQEKKSRRKINEWKMFLKILVIFFTC